MVLTCASSSRRSALSSRWRSFDPAAAAPRDPSSLSRSLSLSSPAAFSVKVTETISVTSASPVSMTRTMRWTSSVVLPVPAAASTMRVSSSAFEIRSRSFWSANLAHDSTRTHCMEVLGKSTNLATPATSGVRAVVQRTGNELQRQRHGPSSRQGASSAFSLFLRSNSSGLAAIPSIQRVSCETETECVTGGSLTCTCSCVPGPIWSTQPCFFMRLRPNTAASYSDSAVTSTAWLIPVGPAKLTVHAFGTMPAHHSTFALYSPFRLSSPFFGAGILSGDGHPQEWLNGGGERGAGREG